MTADKPFRDALRMELAAAGVDMDTLRSLLDRAVAGDMQAIKELADQLRRGKRSA